MKEMKPMFRKSIQKNHIKEQLVILLLIFFPIFIIQELKCEDNVKEFKMTQPSIIEKIKPPEQEKISFIGAEKPEIKTNLLTCDEILNNHFESDYNCDFKDALKNPIISKQFTRKRWIIKNHHLAIPARNHKVVFQNVNDCSYIFKVTSNRSLLVNLALVNQFSDQYYKHPTIVTPYFLIQFQDREIPTYFPDITLNLLNKWKKKWIQENNVSIEYFVKHIKVYNVRLDFWEEKNINQPYTFIVEYFFTVDWAKTKLTDRYVLEKYANPELPIKSTQITIIEPIESIIPVQEVIDKVSSISDSIYMNINGTKLYFNKLSFQSLKSLDMDTKKKMISQKLKGRLTIPFQGNLDFKKNRRLLGRIYLDTGEIEVNKNAAIIIY